MLRYGVPLDSRTRLTKTDWSFSSATLAENQADFETIISATYDYLNETTVRDPIADSYETDKIQSGGMHARPVIGGLFIKMLSDRAVWEKWASRDKLKPANWAPLPAPPKFSMVVPTERTWRYTMKKPGDDWTKTDFDATAWKQGRAGFGTLPPGFVRHTDWTTDDIWLRREITLPEGEHPRLQFVVYHDEDVEIYVNGVLAATEAGFTTYYVPLEISPAARTEMRPDSKILVAVHCHQTIGGQGIERRSRRCDGIKAPAIRLAVPVRLPGQKGADQEAGDGGDFGEERRPLCLSRGGNPGEKPRSECRP